MSITIYEYQVEYPKMTKKLHEEKRMLWDMIMIAIRADELQKGFYLRKIGKPRKKGTVFTFRVCKNDDEWNKEFERLKEDAKRIGCEISVIEKEGDGDCGKS